MFHVAYNRRVNVVPASVKSVVSNGAAVKCAWSRVADASCVAMTQRDADKVQELGQHDT